MRNLVLGLAMAATATVGFAMDAPRTPLLQALAVCRGIAGSTERLACFDQAAAQLDEAEQRGDVLVADREELRENRRSLFGLPLPSLSLFNRKATKPEPPIERIDTTLKSTRQANYKWEFVLADGARWRQTDSRTLIGPSPGANVTVRRAAMGSYFLKVEGEPAVRAMRVN